MAIKTTLEEHRFLLNAEEDIVKYGKTERKCPRCGNDIIIEEVGNSYSVKCKTDGCIHADFRGI